MGNCIKPADPLIASLPRGINVDCTPIKESGLPIIFIIGGPGAGKKTLCNIVAKKYGFDEMVATDILRNEVAKRSERAFALARLMSQGQLVPSNILVELIAVRMLAHLDNKKGFIVSGFPREKEQGRVFDKQIRPPDLVLLLNVRNSVMTDRIMARNIKATERPSINMDHIKSQIKEFHKRNRPIVKYYRKLLVAIDAEYDVMIVLDKACEAIDNVLANFPAFQVGTSAVAGSTVKNK